MIDPIDKIADDLELSKYKPAFLQIPYFNERVMGRSSTKLYDNCILYSAASMWIKASLLDENSEGRSNRYYAESADCFLEQFYLTHKYAKVWFSDNLSNKPGTFILNKMIECGEVCVVRNDNCKKIAFFSSKHIRLSDTLERVTGLEYDYHYDFVSGLSFISKLSKNVKEFKLINNDQWILGYLDNLKTKTGSYIENCSNKEYLMPNGSFDENIEHVYENKMVYTVVRVKTAKGNNHYLFYNKFYYEIDNDTFKKNYSRFRINIIDEGHKLVQINRYGNDDSSIIVLRLKTPLPKYEESLIRSVMWPMKDISDKFNFVGPGFLIEYVQKIMIALGMKVRIND